MSPKTDAIQRNTAGGATIDAFDRRILGALVEDAQMSYSRLGERVGLSAPAVHERVKRLRRSGALASTSAIVNADAVGKHLLAFVHIDTTGWGKSDALMKIADYPEVEEIHSVAGDTCMLLKVRTGDTHALEAILGQLYAVPSVTATRSYVVLSTYLERPVQAEITTDWPSIPMK